LRLWLPVWGPAYRKAVLSRSVRTLGIMLHNQVPILDALRLCAQVSGSRIYGDAWTDVSEKVSSGARIGDSLPSQPLFPTSLRQMLRAGEESGRLPLVLDKISKQYERDVETAFKTATAMLEPLLIAFMGIVVGAIGWSLLIPIFSLSRPA
jgi:type IV pilus assembly protein PilC